MNWDTMKDFLAVAETGSLSAAARRLGTSQPTIGRRIATMEDELDETLFIRTPSGLEITEAGELLLQHAKRMNDEMMAAERLLTGRTRTLSGNVTISVIEGMGANWLTREMRAFSEQHPDITIEIRVELIAADLVRREADIAIRMFEPTQLDLISKKGGTMTLGMYASESYLEQYGMPLSMQDLQKHRIVLASKDYLHFIEKHWRTITPDLGPVVYRSNNMTALLNAIEEGYGIGVHSCLLADGRPSLVRIFPEMSFAQVDFWLVTHSDLRRSAPIRAVYDYISALLKRNQDKLLGLHSLK